MSNSSLPPLRPLERPAPADAAERPVAAAARPSLADWLDLLALLRQDEGAPDTELRRRDRAIGARIAADPDRPERWLVAWVRTRRGDPTASAAATAAGPARGDAVAGVRTAEAVGWSAALLGLAGLVFGSAAALGAFSFQPQGRINVVAAFGALVVLPSLLLLMALLNALPARLRRQLPLVGREREGGALLQPARWMLRLLPQSMRESLETAWARGQSWERVAAPVQRWLLLSVSQGAALAFQVGALASAFALVVFSDLSFGWSTTLSVEAETAHRVTQALSLPWGWAWPEAVPSLELIERTRFFRIAAEVEPGVSPELYGGWWPFLLASMAVYGLAPRLVFFVFARSRLRRGLVRAVVDAPDARRLLARMQAPLVETTAEGAEAGDARPGADGAVESSLVAWPARAVVVSWAEAAEQASPAAHGERLAAGGRLTPGDDRRTAATAAERARDEGLPVAVVVRGFEPPVLEIVDFLRDVRGALGEGREIVVGLVGADAAHRHTWQRRLAKVGDPWLACAEYAPAGDASAETSVPEASPGGTRT